MANNKKRKHATRVIQDKPKVNVSTMFIREAELKKQFEQEKYNIISDACDMYSIALAMVLSDKYHQTADQISVVLEAITKLCDEFLEDRLSIGDCRKALFDEIGLAIGEEELYKQLETGETE